MADIILRLFLVVVATTITAMIVAPVVLLIVRFVVIPYVELCIAITEKFEHMWKRRD